MPLDHKFEVSTGVFVFSNSPRKKGEARTAEAMKLPCLGGLPLSPAAPPAGPSGEGPTGAGACLPWSSNSLLITAGAQNRHVCHPQSLTPSDTDQSTRPHTEKTLNTHDRTKPLEQKRQVLDVVERGDFYAKRTNSSKRKKALGLNCPVMDP